MEKKNFALSPVFGPTPSHRFGVTLGIDLLKGKTCTQDCVFCQLGRTTLKTEERLSFSLIKEIEKGLDQSKELFGLVKYVAFAGSGEPTLSLELGEAIKLVKRKTSLPVIVFTSGVLLSRNDVLGDIQNVDILVVKLVSGIKETYNAIFKPFNELSFLNYKNSLLSLRNNFKGIIWLDIILLHGMNTTKVEIKSIDSLVKKVNAQEVHLSLPTRPSGISYKIFLPTEEEIKQVCLGLGLKTESQSSGDLSKNILGKDTKEKIISIVSRRPCTVKELAKILFLDEENVQKTIFLIKEIEIVEANNEKWVILRRIK